MRRIVLLLLLFSLLCVPAHAAIELYDASGLDQTITVEPDGTYTAEATVELAFTEEGDEIALPLGPLVDDADCKGYNTKLTEDDDGVFWLTIASDENLKPGKYEISWSGAVDFDADRDKDKTTAELIVLSAHWPGSVQGVSFEFKLPKAIDEDDLVLTSGYFGELSGDAVTLNVDDTTLSGAFSGQLLDHEALTLPLELPYDYFELPIVPRRFISPVKLIVPVLCLLLLAYWFFTLRTQRATSGTQKLPPDGVCAGDVSYLMFGTRPNMALTAVQWASLGYLTLLSDRSGALTLERSMGMGNERKNYERKLFSALFAQSNTVSGTDTRLRQAFENIEQPLAAHWRKRIFDRRSGSVGLLQFGAAVTAAVTCARAGAALEQTVMADWLLAVLLGVIGLGAGIVLVNGALLIRRKTGLVLTVMAAATLCILLLLGSAAGLRLTMLLSCVTCCFAGLVTAYGGRRSRFGRDLLARLRALRRFFTTADQKQLRRLLRQDPQYYYKMLPFAEALGVGRAFTKRFGALRLDPCEWYRTGSNRSTTAQEFYPEFRAAVSAIQGK